MSARRREPLTTEELLITAGVTREAVYMWVAQKLLARPTFTTGTSSLIAVWPHDTHERVRFILEKQREGLPLKELVELVRARWPAPK